MKRSFVPLAFALTLWSGAGFAQGTIIFANKGVGLDAPVTNWDGTGLAGSAFGADLYWAPGIVTDSTVLVGLGAPTYFLTNGYFDGGARTIPFTPGTVITLQVRVADLDGCPPWQWDLARCNALTFQHGESALFQVTVTSPPDPPASLKGLEPFGISPPTTPGAPRFTLNSMSGDRLVFSWPPSVVGNFVLQQNDNLGTTNWVTSTDAPDFVGPQFQVVIPKPAGTMFYRLVSK
jgi:hypothetical protein